MNFVPHQATGISAPYNAPAFNATLTSHQNNSDQLACAETVRETIEEMHGNVEQLHSALLYLCGDKNQSGIENFISVVKTDYEQVIKNFNTETDCAVLAYHEHFKTVYQCLINQLPQDELLELVDLTQQVKNIDEIKLVTIEYVQGKVATEVEEGICRDLHSYQLQPTIKESHHDSQIVCHQNSEVSLQSNLYKLNNNFILLYNHTDIGFMNLLLRNTEWVINTFDAIYVECAPRHFDINQILNLNFTTHLTQIIKVGDLSSFFTSEEIAALLFCLPAGERYSDNPSKYDVIHNNKLIGVEKFCACMQELKQPVQAYAGLLRLLSNMKLINFYKGCVESGAIQIFGVEPENYQVGLLPVEKRDPSMTQTVLENPSGSRNALFIVGAEHGIGLMTNLCPLGRGGFQFARLTVDRHTYSPHAPFSKWHEHNMTNKSGHSVHPGYGSSFQLTQLNLDNSQAQQDQEFRSLYKPCKGLVPVPSKVAQSTNSNVNINEVLR